MQRLLAGKAGFGCPRLRAPLGPSPTRAVCRITCGPIGQPLSAPRAELGIPRRSTCSNVLIGEEILAREWKLFRVPWTSNKKVGCARPQISGIPRTLRHLCTRPIERHPSAKSAPLACPAARAPSFGARSRSAAGLVCEKRTWYTNRRWHRPSGR